MAERKPEFISLMRTIRDVYYKEMGATVLWMKNTSNIFYLYVQQIKNATIRTVTTVTPIDDITLGVATVVVDTISDPSKMQFDFGIPAGLKGQQGDTGQGVSIIGSDTSANIYLKTTAQLGDCWISLDAPIIQPPSGVSQIGDGLVPLIANPTGQADWLNVGQIRGPAGIDGLNGQDGDDGLDGRDGSKWWSVPAAPSGPGDIPGAIIGDYALVTSEDIFLNGEYYELFGAGWTHIGHLKGNTGATGLAGSVWYNGVGVPSDALGVNADYYVDIATNLYYTKIGAAWGSSIGTLDGNTVKSLADSGGVTGSNAIAGIISCTQAEYDAGVPESNYTYLIVG